MMSGGDRKPEHAGDLSQMGRRASRAAALRARRRRRAVRTAGLAIVVVLVVVGAFFSVRFLMRSEAPAVAGTSTTAAPKASVGTLLAVQQDASVGAFLLIDGRPPGTLLAIPASTIVTGQDGFVALNELMAQGAGLTAQAVAGLLQGAPGRVAQVTWADLRAATVRVGKGGSLPPALEDEGEAAQAVLDAAAAIAAAAGTSEGTAAVADLKLSGDGAEDARGALRSLPDPPSVQAVLPGKAIKTEEAVYFEPDPVKLAVLIGLPTEESKVQIEVQNGSGEVGIAEEVAAILKPMGFSMLPIRNAEQFPDVAKTQILAAADCLAQADRVRDALGTGKVVEQKELPVGRVVVVVGKDLTAAALPEAGG